MEHLMRNEDFLNSLNDGINTVEYCQNEFTRSKFVYSRYTNGLPNKVKTFKTANQMGKVIDHIQSKLLRLGGIEFQFDERNTRIATDNLLIDLVSKSDKLTTIDIVGDPTRVDTILNHIKDEFAEISVMIQWVYSDDGNRFDIPLTPPKHEVTDSAYPYIENGLDDFIDTFKESSENILILLGPPGTGKSTFLKYMLGRMKRDAIVTYDTKILEKDYFFGEFMEGSNGVLIMEDADTFLEARSAGNVLMHKFLNVGDGLVSAPNKKIIFTTNLDSSDNIDKALMRPGRCFAVVNFRALTQEEAKAFMDEYTPNHEVSLTEKTYTLAELYNKVRSRTVVETKAKFGFY